MILPALYVMLLIHQENKFKNINLRPEIRM